MVVALTLTAVDRKAEDGGDPGAHRRAVRADLGRFADDRTIDMVDDRSALRGPARRHGRGNWSDAAPFHCGSRRREMLADVAEPGGAEQGVGDRVEHDVGVAVPGQAAIVRDFDPAEHDRARRRQRHGRRSPMPVRLTMRAGQPLLGAGEVGGGGQSCRASRSPSTAATFSPAATQDRAFVGRRAPGHFAIRVAQSLGVERLRGLDPDQAGAIDASPSVPRRLRERVADREHRRRAVVKFERRRAGGR